MSFDEKKWDEMVETILKNFNIEESRKQNLKENKVAKLIAMLPYIVKSNYPERYSYANFIVYVFAVLNKHIFLQKKGESIESRIKAILNFDGGDSKLIERAKYLLSLISLEDHKKDIDIDKKEGKYNPISEGDIDYETNKKYYMEKISKIESPEMDSIIKPEEAVNSFWGW